MDEKFIPQYLFQPSYYRAAGASYTKRAKEDEEAKLKQIECYRDAPEPRVIKVGNLVEGTISSLHYEVGVLFDSTTYKKPTTSYEQFYPKDHSCKLYRWHAKAKIMPYPYSYVRSGAFQVPSVVYEYPEGAYYEWLEHKRSKPTKWKKLTEDPRSKGYSHQSRIIPAHLFFKTEEDFENWVGKENYALLFTDLLK